MNARGGDRREIENGNTDGKWVGPNGCRFFSGIVCVVQCYVMSVTPVHDGSIDEFREDNKWRVSIHCMTNNMVIVL